MAKKQTVGQAVANALGTKQAQEMSDAKALALQHFASAVLAFIKVDEEAQSLAGSEWENYIRAHCAGATKDELRDAASEMAETDDADKATKNRCRQYAYRLGVLADAGVPLMVGDALNEPVMVNGAQVAETLGGYAQKLAKEKGGKGTRAPRQSTGEGADAGAQEPTVIQPDPETVPVTVGLMARVGAALNMEGADKLRAALIETCPDAIMAMAGIIAKGRLERAVADVAVKAKAKATAAASVGEVADAKRKVRATVRRTDKVIARKTAQASA
jgi:hypothetical protein